MSYDTGDEVEVGRRKKKHELRAEQEREELSKLFASPGAPAFFWRLLSECQMFHSISRGDPHDMAIASGRRDVGLWLFSELLQANPQAYELMYRDHKERNDG